MTVEELIAHLQTLDGNKEVKIISRRPYYVWDDFEIKDHVLVFPPNEQYKNGVVVIGER